MCPSPLALSVRLCLLYSFISGVYSPWGVLPQPSPDCSHSLSAFPHETCSSPLIVLVPFTQLTPAAPYHSPAGRPELDSELQVLPPQCYTEGTVWLPLPGSRTPPRTATVPLACCATRSLCCSQSAWCLLGPQLLQSWLPASPNTGWCTGLFLLRCRTLQLPLLSFPEFLSTPPSEQQHSLCCVSYTP